MFRAACHYLCRGSNHESWTLVKNQSTAHHVARHQWPARPGTQRTPEPGQVPFSRDSYDRWHNGSSDSGAESAYAQAKLSSSCMKNPLKPKRSVLSCSDRSASEFTGSRFRSCAHVRVSGSWRCSRFTTTDPSNGIGWPEPFGPIACRHRPSQTSDRA